MEAVAMMPAMQQQLGEMLPRLRRFARSLAGDHGDADDLVQIALERALSRSGQWRPEQGLAPWLFGIVRNAWLDEMRSRRRRGLLFVAEEAAANVGHATVEAHATGLAVAAALQRLPHEQRVVVALVLVEGLSYREAADALEVPVGTVTSRLARARLALQEMLGDDHE
jgi:RNA polymerase sigma-70 factor (ECF subfamily)